jgi:hypothetical protein
VSNINTDLGFASFKLTTASEHHTTASKELKAAIKVAFDTIERLKHADLDYHGRECLKELSKRAYELNRLFSKTQKEHTHL